MIHETVTLVKQNVSVKLTDTSNAAAVMGAVDRICSALTTTEAGAEKLRVLLGKVVAQVQDKKLYEPTHTSFEAWTTSVAEKHHLSRATIREALMIVRRLPDLTPEQAESIPQTSLALVARATKPDSKPEAIKAMLVDAAKMPVAEFRTKLQEAGSITRPSIPEGKTRITLVVSESLAKKWATVAGDDPVKFLTSLLTNYMREVKAQKVAA